MKDDTEKWRKQFDTIVDLYKGRIMNMLYRILRNKSDVEDVTQEVFIRIYKGLPYFRHQSKFTTWLYRIVHNVAISEIRKRKGLTENIEDYQDISQTYALNGTSTLNEKQVKELLNTALDKIPETYKMVLLLYYMEEQTYTEISTIMDIPIGTVKTYLHRGKKMLRHLLIDKAIYIQ